MLCTGYAKNLFLTYYNLNFNFLIMLYEYNIVQKNIENEAKKAMITG